MIMITGVSVSPNVAFSAMEIDFGQTFEHRSYGKPSHEFGFETKRYQILGLNLFQYGSIFRRLDRSILPQATAPR